MVLCSSMVNTTNEAASATKRNWALAASRLLPADSRSRKTPICPPKANKKSCVAWASARRPRLKNSTTPNTFLPTYSGNATPVCRCSRVATDNRGKFSSLLAARKVATFRHFFKFLLMDGRIAANPMLRVESPKGWKALPKWLTLQKSIRF